MRPEQRDAEQISQINRQLKLILFSETAMILYNYLVRDEIRDASVVAVAH